ncbi:hypothetical protein AB0O14_01480 [Microbacterium foliorum]|jgi:hypothetical protein|uniref:Uncharacterized protein n=1 Tax=Microbacterium foliorum TaxID=104336 RepID=A0A4Y5YQQ4_9MICO|nr:hypothetical protein [Microbacterium foliorum]QDE35047.1 hypothetical protein FIV50_09790 [Microbacterium foliorum]
MADTLGMLLTIAILLVVVIAIVVVIVAVYAKAPLERKYESAGGGLGGSFEAVWMPSAHEAGMERDRQTKRTAPAPSPGDPPSRIDGERIVIDI